MTYLNVVPQLNVPYNAVILIARFCIVRDL